MLVQVHVNLVFGIIIFPAVTYSNKLNTNLPTAMRVRFADGTVDRVTPLHSTTVPFSSAVAVNLKVDVRSARLFMSRVPTLVSSA